MIRRRLTTFGKVLDVLTRTVLLFEGIVLVALPGGFGNDMSIPFCICANVVCCMLIYATLKFYEYIFIE